MVMITNFPYQTGEYSFGFEITPTSNTGNFSFGVGVSGINAKTIEVSGNSGELSINGLGVVSSYLAGNTFLASGVVRDESYSLLIGGRLVATDIPSLNQGGDFLFFNKGDDSQYSIGNKAFGKNTEVSLRAKYITLNSDDESGFINLMSGMGMFSVFNVSEASYSGTLSDEDVVDLNSFDVVVIGINNQTGDFSDYAGWSSVETPMILLNQEVASQDALKIISGRVLECLGEKSGVATDLSNDVFVRTSFQDTNKIGMYTGDNKSELFFYTITGSESVRMLVTGVYDKALLSYTNIGDINYPSGVAQSGLRVLVSIPLTGDYDTAYDSLTNEWKKLILHSALKACTSGF